MIGEYLWFSREYVWQMLQELKLLAHKKNAQPSVAASDSESSSGSDHEVFHLSFNLYSYMTYFSRFFPQWFGLLASLQIWACHFVMPDMMRQVVKSIYFYLVIASMFLFFLVANS